MHMKFHVPSFRHRRPDSTPEDLEHTGKTCIAYVPDDVLYEIFCLIVVDAYETRPLRLLDRKKRYRGDNMPALTISHICSYWRKLALETPILWTLIEVAPYSHPAMLDEFLVRSRAAPLVIRFHASLCSFRPLKKDYLLEHAQTLSSHVERFVEFDVKRLDTTTAENVLSYFTSPSTHLQHLSLRTDGMPFPCHQFPFAETLPSLRNVRIEGIQLPWLRYTNLTRLILTSQFALRLKDLAWTLQRCPDLEVLTIRLLDPEMEDMIAVTKGLTLPPPDILFPNVTSKIALPRLRKLSAHWAEKQPGMLFILGCLVFPSTAAVNLSFHGERETPFILLSLSKAWSMVAAQLGAARLMMWHAVYGNSFSLYFHSKDEVSTIRWYFDAGGIDAAMSVLKSVGIETLSLPSLRSLNIYACDAPLRRRQWLFLLRHISPTVVVDVSVDGGDAGASAFLSALRQGLEADSDAQAGDVLCPHLRNVTFSANLWASPQTVLGDVLATFRARAARDVRLPALQIWRTKRFRSPKPPKHLVAQVEDVVETVTFDLMPKFKIPKHYYDHWRYGPMPEL
ncbi:hypothetical protein B0H21DRAFT_250719 [Amylocystis lapponica]|nr:hypothetical protein B0H21DRAFT_250719 [Amylocystis lapponica]